MKSWRMVAAISLVALAGCGGGDGGSGGGTVQLPQPTPTPTPAPPPVASPVYPVAFDLSRDWRSAGAGAEATIIYSSDRDTMPRWAYTSSDSYVSSGATDGEVSFKFDDKSVFVTFHGENSRYTRDQIAQSEDEYFTTYNSSIIVTGRVESYTMGLVYRYHRYTTITTQNFYDDRGFYDSSFQVKETNRVVLGGSRTEVTDLPSNGTSNYAGHLLTLLSRAAAVLAGPASISINHATGAVDARFPIEQVIRSERELPVKLTVVLSGRMVSGRNEFTGTITSPDSNYTGSFYGELFGPKGTESAIIFKLNHPTTAARVGFIQLLKQ